MGGKRYFRMLGSIDGIKNRNGYRVIYAPAAWKPWARDAYQQAFYTEYYKCPK